MILSTIDQLKAVVPTIIDDDLTNYQTYIDDADLYLKEEILGSTLYADIESKLTNSSYITHVKLCRQVIALKAYHLAIPFLDLIQTQAGFAVTNTNNQAPASKERVKALREGVQNRLNDSLEYLLRFLDSNSTTKTKWQASPSYTKRYDLLIFSAKEFQNWVNIGESHRMYLALVPIMKHVEDRFLNATVSKDLMDDIKTKVKAGTTLSAAYTAIVSDLKRAEACLTIAAAIERTAVSVDPDGVKLNYQIGESSYSDVNRNRSLVDNYQKEGEYYLNKAMQYILNHLTDFTEYTDSDIYSDQTAGYLGFENAEDDAVFAGGI